MIDVYVDEIRSSLKSKNYYSALSLALILPDICGSIEFPNKSVGDRYIGWYDRYLGEYLKAEEEGEEVRKPYLSGEIVYNLRNKYLHLGQTNVDTNKLKDANNQIREFKLFVCNEMSIPEFAACVKKDNTLLNIIHVDVRYLCSSLADCALWYYTEYKDKFSMDSEIHICDSVEDLGREMAKSFKDIGIDYTRMVRVNEIKKENSPGGQITSEDEKRITHE